MARIPRLTMTGEPAVYHVISRTALDGFALGDVEKEYLFTLLQRFSAVYFTEVLGFCLMGNHFHLLVWMLPETAFSADDIRTRFQRYYGADSARKLTDGQIPTLRAKWASLSEYVKELKQSFSRWYNKRHGRKGFFWGERFKNVLVENGDTLINCLAYIDLNPVRAGLVERPEDYRWCSLAYHVQTGNKSDFLSLDFGLATFSEGDAQTRLQYDRRYVYENGAQPAIKGVPLDPHLVDWEAQKGFALTPVDRLLYRTRYFATLPTTTETPTLCYLYARMLLVVITCALSPPVRHTLWTTHQRELSLLKLVRHFQALADCWLAVLFQPPGLLQAFLCRACATAERLTGKAKRKRRTSA